MTLIAGVLAVAIVVTVWLFLRDRRQSEQAWGLERRELLNRIQFPQLVPSDKGEPFVVPDVERDEWDKVGTIDLVEEVMP